MQTLVGDKKFTQKLEQDVMNLFLGKISGNLWPHVYGTPEYDGDIVRGGILYNEMLENEKDYYLYEYESALFKSQGERLTSIIGPHATFIELGPGSKKSLSLKTLPLLRTCIDLEGYIGIDISQSFLDQGLEVIRTDFPDIQIQGIQQDFMQLTSLPKCNKPVILFKGSTISNLRRDEVPAFVSMLRGIISNDHYLLLVHDANQDETSLMKAYDNPGMALLLENIMYRIARDLDIDSFDPSAFSYKPEWLADSHDLQHVLTATKAQNCTLAGTKIQIEQGQKFHVLSSFKYPVEVFKNILSETGYNPVEFCFDPSERMAAHLFQSFPN